MSLAGAARAIVVAALGRDPGPMTLASSLSHSAAHRAEVTLRDAAYLAADLGIAVTDPGAHARMMAERLRGLEELVAGRYWWVTPSG